ncbi:hypothetical protein LIA77_11378 [Sarocladium implicatum]|nr:hypothetical protein LIA77_11378 [Sarocladium implicatum]
MLHDDLHRVRAFLNATLADPNFDMRFGNPENAMARRDAGASEHFAPPSQAPNTTARGSYYDNIEKTKALTRLAMDVWGKPEPPPGVRLGCVASGNQDQTNGNLIEGIRPSEAYTKAEQDDNRLYMACHASHGATQVNGDEFIPSGEGEPWVISRSRSSYIGCFAINEDAGAEGPRSRQVNGNYYRFDGRQSRTSGSGKK